MMKESISPDYKEGNDDNAIRHRRRDLQQHEYEKDQYTHPPLHSQTYGGYGPIPQEKDLTECKKHRSMVGRILTFWKDQTQRCGCSSYEMLKSEGENGDYYRDEFNDESWTCNFGTEEENGIWMNASDKSGTIMAFLVWFLISYSAITIQLISRQGGIPPFTSMLYSYVCVMALACHAKTTFTDPGAVPQSAVPQEAVRHSNVNHSMCSQCQTFKPPMSHHCRICNRCVSRMDHHCPWMNNCVGAGNLKHFILFLLYTWICSASSMILLCWSYFFCVSDECHYRILLIELVCVMMILSFSAFIFTSSMLMNVCYGLMTGIGTIDRLKKKAQNTMSESMEEPIDLRDVFGIAGYHTWPFPIDPVFEDYDRVMGYSTPQRLLREQLRKDTNSPSDYDNDFYPPSEF